MIALHVLADAARHLDWQRSPPALNPTCAHGGCRQKSSFCIAALLRLQGFLGSSQPLVAAQPHEASRMFENFAQRDVATGETTIYVRIGGDGPPLLLLHGYPQSHVMWHRVAQVLAEHFTVVCADLRGYGDSGKPPSDATHAAYSKRSSARDMVEVMAALGFPRFMLAGHDRGGRVGHRLALDHASRLER